MKGYYKDEEANRLAFTEDGYFKTGITLTKTTKILSLSRDVKRT